MSTPTIIFIEGNIAVGKSTLLKNIQKVKFDLTQENQQLQHTALHLRDKLELQENKQEENEDNKTQNTKTTEKTKEEMEVRNKQ